MIYPTKIQHAVQFASHKHKHQKRKILDYPYVTHPLVVFHLVSKFTDDQDVLCAAILHDTVEDTKTTLDKIEKEFGERVSYLVDILSEDKSLEKKERKKKYYKRIFEENNNDVFLIKSADILYNLTDFIATIDYGGKEKFIRMFSDFEKYNFMVKEVVNKFENKWSENPFLSDINFYLNKLDVLLNNTPLVKKVSCGIVPVYINEEGKKEFLILQQHAGHWSFPKGHIDEGESFLDTAKRELFEESGIIPTKIITENYFTEHYLIYKKDYAIEKTVHLFIGFVEDKNVVIQEKEIKDFYWGDKDTVANKLAFEGDKREVFNEVVSYMNKK